MQYNSEHLDGCLCWNQKQETFYILLSTIQEHLMGSSEDVTVVYLR